MVIRRTQQSRRKPPNRPAKFRSGLLRCAVSSAFFLSLLDVAWSQGSSWSQEWSAQPSRQDAILIGRVGYDPMLGSPSAALETAALQGGSNREDADGSAFGSLRPLDWTPWLRMQSTADNGDYTADEAAGKKNKRRRSGSTQIYRFDGDGWTRASKSAVKDKAFDEVLGGSTFGQIEIRGGEKFYDVGPAVGLVGNTRSGLLGYGAVYGHLDYGDVIVSPLAGLLSHLAGNESDIGGGLQLGLGVGVHYKLTDRSRLGLRLAHMHDLSIADPGEGEAFLTYGWRF